MNQGLDTAVILAAGMGTRLKDHTQERPKGFLEIDHKSLIDRSIQSLQSHGIRNIIIGTGYFHEQFDFLKTRYSGISTFRNTEFAESGSMYTLFVIRHLIEGPFLLLESDLLYDPAALDYLLKDPVHDIVLASGPTDSGDEVFIQHSSEGFLQNMTKNRSALQHVDGELVGISKLTRAALDGMASFAERAFRTGDKMMNYEDALVGISKEYNVFIKVIQDLVWCEIDDENHLHRAVTKIYPRIVERMESKSK